MMVTFVSECEKKALKNTRRVLDAFANRIGTRTWQTVITQDGLKAVKKLLRRTASKNSAIACHWQRSRSRSDLLWIVGNRRKFNREGYVAVNFTENEIDKYFDSSSWRLLPLIQYAVTIAALFHDFGKATLLFQDKIDFKVKTSLFEPYRHEWISLRLFQAFVGERSDEEWLEALSQIERDQDPSCFKDGLDHQSTPNPANHPIQQLSPFARLIAWLILTHHKLPLYPKWKQNADTPPPLTNKGNSEVVAEWMHSNFDVVWNSHNCKDPDQQSRIKQNWEFSEKGLPYQSNLWRSTACLLASEAKIKLNITQLQETDWINEQLFTAHISRLCLMLADHYYSAQGTTEEWRSSDYNVWANTDKHTRDFKQQLDEHLVGVAHHAQAIACTLPKLNSSLATLGVIDTLEAKVTPKNKKNFGWQDEARKCAEKLAESTTNQGFFGINMASTGKGKTRANAKIMYALGNGIGRKRFSVALGLRTLTLQTGREFREEIGLSDEELAITVGGAAVRQLFENEQNKQQGSPATANECELYGSESEDLLVDPDLTVDYRGKASPHSLSAWTRQEKGLDHFIDAPVLVCTIDHLIPTTEGTKGGKQIAPTLRLLTSDLVLDEPDDFGLEDLPALCRLVHWAGLLGSRVLFSTATMPPSLSYALFLAYKDGWKEYGKANLSDWNGEIVCAWFDEFKMKDETCSELPQFRKAHDSFVQKRIKKLTTETEAKRLGKIIKIDCLERESTTNCLARTIQGLIIQLHGLHQQENGKNRVSVGLVRMANIDPLVAVARELLTTDVPENDTAIHYCIYHSRYPLAIRSHMENKLDKILKRKDPEKIWQHPEIKQKLQNNPAKNHIFVVLASPVAEVGRDHDYDWAIVEPSSMRSIIQLAGRVLRHRLILPSAPNIYLLNKNYKALAGKDVCFTKPGFEGEGITAQLSHDLLETLTKEQYATISAIPRIAGIEDSRLKENHWSNLVELEHKALTRRLFNGESPANVWWKYHPQWCGEVQRQQHFRQSPQDEPCYLYIADENRAAKWQWKNEHVSPPQFGEPESIGITIKALTLADHGKGNDFWFELDASAIYAQLAKELKIDTLAEVSRRFGELRIIEYENTQQEYVYHSNLGGFQEKEHEK